eukprot:2390706-Prymnesium_polylepis.1
MGPRAPNCSVRSASQHRATHSRSRRVRRYMLVFLYHGRLPWQGIKSATRKEKHARILALKRQTPLHVLCQGMPRRAPMLRTRGADCTLAPPKGTVRAKRTVRAAGRPWPAFTHAHGRMRFASCPTCAAASLVTCSTYAASCSTRTPTTATSTRCCKAATPRHAQRLWRMRQSRSSHTALSSGRMTAQPTAPTGGRARRTGLACRTCRTRIGARCRRPRTIRSASPPPGAALPPS